MSLAEEAAIAAVTLVHNGITTGGALDHRVQLGNASLRPALSRALVVLALRDHVSGRCVAKTRNQWAWNSDESSYNRGIFTESGINRHNLVIWSKRCCNTLRYRASVIVVVVE